MDLIWIYLLLVNVGSLLLMGFDKLSAKMNFERVPEVIFFLISLAGGFAGVTLGMIIFRHKTRRIGFQLKILAAAILAILILLFMFMRK